METCKVTPRDEPRAVAGGRCPLCGGPLTYWPLQHERHPPLADSLAICLFCLARAFCTVAVRIHRTIPDKPKSHNHLGHPERMADHAARIAAGLAAERVAPGKTARIAPEPRGGKGPTWDTSRTPACQPAARAAPPAKAWAAS